MFNKLKYIKDLRDQAKIMQNTLGQENFTVEKNGVTLQMNGNMEITGLTINNEMPKEKMEKTLVELINDAIKKAQKIMAQKMQEMGGINNFKF